MNNRKSMYVGGRNYIGGNTMRPLYLTLKLSVANNIIDHAGLVFFENNAHSSSIAWDIFIKIDRLNKQYNLKK